MAGWKTCRLPIITPILDPTCSDLTARTLELFGYIGFDRFDPSVKEALGYLIRTQEDDGSWYGRWGVKLHLRHMAGIARASCYRSGHDPGLDSARSRLARELSERRRRLGRNLRNLRRSFGKRKRRQHSFTDGVGNYGDYALVAI
jgi:hypothetical protein